MHHRSLATIISSGVIGLASLTTAPAPLTERPGVQAEFARPHVAPLEEAFADAQTVKRAVEYRARAVAMENR